MKFQVIFKKHNKTVKKYKSDLLLCTKRLILYKKQAAACVIRVMHTAETDVIILNWNQSGANASSETSMQKT